MCSYEGRYITGTDIIEDGGIRLQMINASVRRGREPHGRFILSVISAFYRALGTALCVTVGNVPPLVVKLFALCNRKRYLDQ